MLLFVQNISAYTGVAPKVATKKVAELMSEIHLMILMLKNTIYNTI